SGVAAEAVAERGVTLTTARTGWSLPQHHAEGPLQGSRLPALQPPAAAYRLQLAFLEADGQQRIGIVDRDKPKVALRHRPHLCRRGVAEDGVDRRPLGGADRPAGRMAEERLVTDAEQVQYGRTQVLRLHAATCRIGAELVAGAVHLSATDARSC